MSYKSVISSPAEGGNSISWFEVNHQGLFIEAAFMKHTVDRELETEFWFSLRDSAATGLCVMCEEQMQKSLLAYCLGLELGLLNC